MGFDGAIRCREGHADEYEPGRDLVLIEEGLILLVHGATDQLAGAGRTGVSAAGHRQINLLIRRRIVDRLIVTAVDGAVQALVGVDERDLVGGHGSRSGKGSSLDRFAAQPAGSGCRKPSPHLGRLYPRLGGAVARAVGRECGLSSDSVKPMEMMLSELVLAALLLAVVILSGRI